VVASHQALKRRTASHGSAVALGLPEASYPETDPAMSLADRTAENRAVLATCNAALKAELEATRAAQAHGNTAHSSIEVRTGMMAAKRSLASFNTAVRSELEQLASQLSELLRQRAELRQRPARPCWETTAAA